VVVGGKPLVGGTTAGAGEGGLDVVVTAVVVVVVVVLGLVVLLTPDRFALVVVERCDVVVVPKAP
jgi:hypothetical protein